MHNIDSTNRFPTTIYDLPVQITNSVIKTTKTIFKPLSTSLPVSYILRITDKSLKLVNEFSSKTVFPHLAKSLEGINDVFAIGSFVNLGLTFVPHLTQDNLDENALRASLDAVSLPGEEFDDKWAKRVVKQTKASLKTRYTKKAVRNDIAQMLMKKEIAAETAYALAGRITLKSKHTPSIEKVYNFCFLISKFNSVVTTLNKWNLIDLGKIAGKIGNSQAAHLFSQAVNSNVTKFLAKWSLSRLASVALLTGLSTKFAYDSYKLVRLQLHIRQLDPTSDEYAASIKERTDKIWAVALGTLYIAGEVVPLVLTISPPLLISYEIGVLALGLFNALR